MPHIFGLLLLGGALAAQKIWEENPPQDDEEDEQFDEDNDPQRLAHGHTAKSVVIKMENAGPQALFGVGIVTIHDYRVLNNSQS